MMGRPGEGVDAIELICLSFIKEQIGTLNRLILYTRRAIDSFYKAY